jgi:hypothetical protein
MRYAVIIFVTLAIGTSCCLPVSQVWLNPLTVAADSLTSGHSILAVAGCCWEVTQFMAIESTGSGARNRTVVQRLAARTITAPAATMATAHLALRIVP